jgi:hypothetical protein
MAGVYHRLRSVPRGILEAADAVARMALHGVVTQCGLSIGALVVSLMLGAGICDKQQAPAAYRGHPSAELIHPLKVVARPS